MAPVDNNPPSLDVTEITSDVVNVASLEDVTAPDGTPATTITFVDGSMVLASYLNDLGDMRLLRPDGSYTDFSLTYIGTEHTLCAVIGAPGTYVTTSSATRTNAQTLNPQPVGGNNPTASPSAQPTQSKPPFCGFPALRDGLVSLAAFIGSGLGAVAGGAIGPEIGGRLGIVVGGIADPFGGEVLGALAGYAAGRKFGPQLGIAAGSTLGAIAAGAFWDLACN